MDMKKIIALLMALTLLFGTTALAADYSYLDGMTLEEMLALQTELEGRISAAKNAAADSDPTNLGIWTVRYYVDEFQNPTTEGYITTSNYVVGTFSNSATTNSDLYVIWLIDSSDVAIKLLEYGRNVVKSSYDSTSYSITMLDPDGNKVSMIGTMYEGSDRNDDTLTAPTAADVAALIEVQGQCDHGEVAVALSAVKYSVVTYKDAEDAVLAQVTFRTADVTAAVAAALSENHTDVTVSNLQALFTLTQTDAETAGWDLSKIQLHFTASCKKAITYHTVKYVDGCNDQVFPKEVYKIRHRTLTPYCAANVYADEFRPGYTFAGWSPAFEEKVKHDVTYTAQWTAKTYTITYVGVPEGVTNPNATTYTIETSVQLSDLATDGFVKWTDASGNTVKEIPVGTTGDITLTANIVAKPTMPKSGTNVAPNLFTFQCTTHPEHSWTISTTISANAKRTYWNSSAKRWETFVYAQFYNINTTQTRKNYFGGLTHHYADDAQSVKYYLYWNPSASGQTSLGAAVTGQWYAVSGNPITLNVWCYDKPAAPSKVTTKLWIRDWTNTSNYAKTTSLIAGTYTVGDVYKTDKGFFVDVAITDLTPYLAPMAGKSTGSYIIDPAQAPGTIGYRMKYTGSTTDYKQDGTGWALDTSDWTKQDSLNGKTIWVIPQWTTTYTDGAEGTVFADKVITYPTSSEGIAQNAAKNGKLLTPTFGDAPVREGFTFIGWTPAISEKLTDSITYTAQWEEIVPEVTPEPDPTETPVPDPSEDPDPTITPEPDPTVTPEPDPSEAPTPTITPEPDPSESPAAGEGEA